MLRIPMVTTTVPSAQEWKDMLAEIGIYRRGESAASPSLAGFSVAVSAIFDAD
jgi:hypothetical protein